MPPSPLIRGASWPDLIGLSLLRPLGVYLGSDWERCWVLPTSIRRSLPWAFAGQRARTGWVIEGDIRTRGAMTGHWASLRLGAHRADARRSRTVVDRDGRWVHGVRRGGPL